MSDETVSHILPAFHFNKGGVEDAPYESLPRQSSRPMPEVRLPANTRMTILQKSQQAQARMPGFAYWLLVLLVAGSTFWICGGHVLFSQRQTVKPHVSGSHAVAPSQQIDLPIAR